MSDFLLQNSHPVNLQSISTQSQSAINSEETSSSDFNQLVTSEMEPSQEDKSLFIEPSKGHKIADVDYDIATDILTDGTSTEINIVEVNDNVAQDFSIFNKTHAEQNSENEYSERIEMEEYLNNDLNLNNQLFDQNRIENKILDNKKLFSQQTILADTEHLSKISFQNLNQADQENNELEINRHLLDNEDVDMSEDKLFDIKSKSFIENVNIFNKSKLSKDFLLKDEKDIVKQLSMINIAQNKLDFNPDSNFKLNDDRSNIQTHYLNANDINLSMNNHKWEKALGDRLIMMINNKNQNATIRLDPPNLGSIEVSIKMDGNDTTILFNTEHINVKDAIESSLDKLRTQFDSEGLKLVDVNVNSQENQSQNDFNQQPKKMQHFSESHDTPEDNDINTVAISKRLLDKYV